jgi:hypothetical protein
MSLEMNRSLLGLQQNARLTLSNILFKSCPSELAVPNQVSQFEIRFANYYMFDD